MLTHANLMPDSRVDTRVLLAGDLRVMLTGNGRVLLVKQAENGRPPVLSAAGSIFDLERLLGPALLGLTLVQVSDDAVVRVSDELERSRLFVGLVRSVLRSVLLLGVHVLQRLGSRSLVRHFSVLHSVSDFGELFIETLERGSKGGVHGSLNGVLDDTGGSGLDKLVENVVVRVLDGELQGVNVDVNVLDTEHAVSSVLNGLEVDDHADTLAADDDVGQTAVLDLGPSSLSSESELDVSEVGLDLGHRESNSVVVLVLHLVDSIVRREAKVVVNVNLDDVGPQVGALQDEVLDDQVNVLVRVLGSGNGHVANLLDQRGQDDPSNVVPQSGLELEVALRIEEQILDESLPVFAESLVQGVITHGHEESLNLVAEVVKVTLVLVVKESLAVVSKLSTFTGRVVIENVSRLQQDSVNVVVQLVVPLPQLGIVGRIGVHVIDRVHQGLHRLVVGESLEQSSELQSSGLVRRVVGNLGGRVATVVGDVLGVTLVVLSLIKEEGDGLLVVLVVLALDNDLLQSVDELVSSLFGEVIVHEVLGLLDTPRCLLSLLVGDGVESLVLGVLLGLATVVVRGVLVGGASSLVLGLFLLVSSSIHRVVRLPDVFGVRLELLLDTTLAALLFVLASSFALGLLLLRVSLVLGFVSSAGCLVVRITGGSLVAVVVNSLGVRGVILGVHSELGALGALELKLGGFVLANSLAIGTDPFTGGSLLVHLVEVALIGPGLVGGSFGSGGEKVSRDEAEVGEKLSGFRVGSEQGDKSPQVGGSCGEYISIKCDQG